jgi:hypothetical protein
MFKIAVFRATDCRLCPESWGVVTDPEEHKNQAAKDDQLAQDSTDQLLSTA